MAFSTTRAGWRPGNLKEIRHEKVGESTFWASGFEVEDGSDDELFALSRQGLGVGLPRRCPAGSVPPKARAEFSAVKFTTQSQTGRCQTTHSRVER